MFFLLILAIFVIGTLVLAKTDAERHFIVFLIRTKHFLRFIDEIARIMPKLWKFIADLAIVLSFSGLGAAYLSKYRKDSRNLDIIMLISGVLAILMWSRGLLLSIVMLCSLLMGISSLSRLKNPFFDFIVATSLISSIFLSAMPWYLAIFEGIFGPLALVFGSLIEHAFAITSGQSAIPGVSPIIPWIEAGQWGFVIPGLGIFVPIGYGLISLILLLVVHEGSHGILARVHKLRLKSTGLLTLGPLPIGAFVEPDEEEFNESESIVKMRVLSMGSFSNLILAILSLLLFIFLIMPSSGWVVKDSNISSIENGTIIMAVDDINISPESHIAAAMDACIFSNRVYTIKNSTIENKSIINVTTNKGIFPVRSEELMGVKLRYVPRFRYSYNFLGIDVSAILINILFWMYFFNFNVALVNLLPILPFDGGKMLIELMSMFNLSEDAVKRIAYTFLFLGLLIILINAYPLLNMLFDWLFLIIT